MKFGELSGAAGVDTENIRYYENIGLFSVPSSHPNGHRDYGTAHVESLADVARLLAFTSTTGEDCSDINQLIDEQIKRVRATC